MSSSSNSRDNESDESIIDQNNMSSVSVEFTGPANVTAHSDSGEAFLFVDASGSTEAVANALARAMEDSNLVSPQLAPSRLLAAAEPIAPDENLQIATSTALGGGLAEAAAAMAPSRPVSSGPTQTMTINYEAPENIIPYVKDHFVPTLIQPINLLDTCVFCQELLSLEVLGKMVVCGHVFHLSCLKTAASYSRKCPFRCDN